MTCPLYYNPSKEKELHEEMVAKVTAMSPIEKRAYKYFNDKKMNVVAMNNVQSTREQRQIMLMRWYESLSDEERSNGLKRAERHYLRKSSGASASSSVSGSTTATPHSSAGKAAQPVFDQPPSAPDSLASEPEWICRHCTTRNNNLLVVCEMCELNRDQ
jgi:hypothetical protein